MYLAKSFLRVEQDEISAFDRENFINIIGELLPNFFADKKMFTKETLSLYYYDEFTIKTCVTEQSASTLYLEINQPENIKEWKKKENRHTYPTLYYPLNSLRNDLYDFFLENFDENTFIWKDSYGINFSINIYDEELEDIRNVNFRIIPCMTYKEDDKESGVLYFNEKSRDLVIEYPKFAIKKFKEKNKKCLGLYKDYCIIFKNIFKIIKSEKVLPSEIFETILYNVPDLFFENYSLDCLKKIMNYIRNSNIINYKSIDEQDFAFVSSYRPFNIIYAKHAIKKLENYIKTLN